jgi:hypothetical protein
MKKIHQLSLLFTFSSAVLLLSGCGSDRTEFDKGYDLGSSDIAKRQYWSQVNLQKQQSNLQKSSESSRYKVVSIPVNGKDADGSNISDHYVSVRVIEK